MPADPKVTGDTPRAVHDAREDLLDAIEDYRNASVRHSEAKQVRMRRALDHLLREVRLAAHEDLVSAAKHVVDDAVWFPLQRFSAGDRQDDAWLVSDADMDRLKELVA